MDVYDYQGMKDYITWGAIELAKVEGELEGKLKGRLEGSAVLLQRQLEKRFGVLSNDVLEKLNHASSEQIEYWTDKIFDITDVDELF